MEVELKEVQEYVEEQQEHTNYLSKRCRLRKYRS